MNEWKYIPGDYWAICDVCGFKYRSSQMKERWDGTMVCESDFELRHSLDFIRSRDDDPSVPWSRPRPTDKFTTVSYILGYVLDGYVLTDYVQEEA